MLQKSILDLRAHQLQATTDGRVTWSPTSQVYATRILIVLFLWMIVAIAWIYTVEMPWQWEARQKRDERRRELMQESERSALQLLAEAERLRSQKASLPPGNFPTTISDGTGVSTLKQVSTASTEWRLQVPGWLKAASCVLGMFGLYWPISTVWHRVVLWRDAEGDIWMRFWFLWPRMSTFPQAT